MRFIQVRCSKNLRFYYCAYNICMCIINSSDMEWREREARNLLAHFLPCSHTVSLMSLQIAATGTHAPQLCRQAEPLDGTRLPTATMSYNFKYSSRPKKSLDFPFALSDWSTFLLLYVSTPLQPVLRATRRMLWFGDKFKRNKTWIGPSIVLLLCSCHSMIYVLIVKYFRLQIMSVLLEFQQVVKVDPQESIVSLRASLRASRRPSVVWSDTSCRRQSFIHGQCIIIGKIIVVIIISLSTFRRQQLRYVPLRRGSRGSPARSPLI